MDIEGQRSKEEQPSVGYPDICFAIEDFDDAFRGLVSSLHMITWYKSWKKTRLQSMRRFQCHATSHLKYLCGAGISLQTCIFSFGIANAHVMACRLCRSLGGVMW